MLHLKTVKYHFLELTLNIFKGLLHRTHLYNFYIKRQLKKRIGNCVSCGNCCWDVQPIKRCPHYKNKKCDRYFSDSRPIDCKNSPLNNLEVKLVGCKGYEFK